LGIVGRQCRSGRVADRRTGLAQLASITAPVVGAGNGWRVVGCVEVIRHTLRCRHGGHREGVGQCVADIERLHALLASFEGVGPHASPRSREGAVAARASFGELKPA